MKRSRSERLSEHLLNIDDDLFAKAYQIDDADKLKQYETTKNAKNKNVISVRPKIYRYAAIAVCMAIVIGMASTLLPLINREDSLPDNGQQHPYPNGDTQSSIHIPPPKAIVFDSLDKVNYYAGLKTILDSKYTLTKANTKTEKIIPLSCNLPQRSHLHALSSTSEADLDNRPADEDDVTPVLGGHDISEERLRITTAIYFQLQVTDADEFLASKVGTGKIDAVMTDLYIGINPYAMITFKNGDRYFSCLTEMHGLQETENTFGTHLYIKGFNFYKDTTNGVSNFKVIRDAASNQITSVSWIPYHRRPAEAPVYPIAVIPNSTYTANTVYEFTLLELEEYYNGTTNDSEESNDEAPRDSEEDSSLFAPPQTAPLPSVTVFTGTQAITPLQSPLWQEYYDKASKSWAQAVTTADAYAILTSGDAVIPVFRLAGDIQVAITGNGTLLPQVKVYFKDQNGTIIQKADFNEDIYRLDDCLEAGEWYVVFQVEWKGEYIPEVSMYERFCNEYIFQLVIK